MAFNPTCLPALPTCSDDILTWAAALADCVNGSWRLAVSEIIEISPPEMDICAELEHLGPGCFVPTAGIDQTQFTYATTASQVKAGNGILPPPPRSTRIDYRAGLATITLDSGECVGDATIALAPTMSLNGYSVILSPGNNTHPSTLLDAPNHLRLANSFRIAVTRRNCADDGNALSVGVYWMAIKAN